MAQEITPRDQFSSHSSDRSSSDEEDDGTWLDAANRNFHFDESGDFDLAPPPSPDLRRRLHSGFDVSVTVAKTLVCDMGSDDLYIQDAFNATSIPVSHDPFANDSDDVRIVIAWRRDLT